MLVCLLVMLACGVLLLPRLALALGLGRRVAGGARGWAFTLDLGTFRARCAGAAARLRSARHFLPAADGAGALDSPGRWQPFVFIFSIGAVALAGPAFSFALRGS